MDSYSEVRVRLAELVAMSQHRDAEQSDTFASFCETDLSSLLNKLQRNIEQLCSLAGQRRSWEKQVFSKMKAQGENVSVLRTEVEIHKSKATEHLEEYRKAMKAKEEAESYNTLLQQRLDDRDGEANRIEQLETLLNERTQELALYRNKLLQAEANSACHCCGSPREAFVNNFSSTALSEEEDEEIRWKEEYDLLKQQSTAIEESLRQRLTLAERKVVDLGGLLRKQTRTAEAKIAAMESQCALVRSLNEKLS